ncbi:MAG: hypothetical protein BBJ57_01975 [Desulfobacterales bacterium PC51MH44]|nr:MAG: hypothetical protein BBJ57_01975 [Desulfobacterales bacterium PC51MH44]
MSCVFSKPAIYENLCRNCIYKIKNRNIIPGFKMTLPIIEFYYKFQKDAVNRIAAPYSPEQDSLISWRSHILFTIIMTGWILGTIAIVASLGLFIRENAWGLALLDVFSFVLCVILIFSNRIRYEIRSSIALFIFFAIGNVVILSVGPLSGGSLWLFTFAVLVAALLGSKPALIAVFLNAFSLSVITWLISTGKIGQDFPFFKTPQAMFATGVNFIVLNAIAAVSVATLVKGLVGTHEKERILTKNLEIEQIHLTKAKKDLEIKIEEHKQAEEALRESENRYRLIAENVADVIWTMDMNLNFTYISPSIYQQRGYSVEEAIAHSLDQVVIPDSHEKMTNLFAEKVALIESGDEEGFKPVDFEVGQPCKDGSVIWTSNNARILPGPANQPAGILGITRDITKRKLAVQALQESEARLKKAQSVAKIGNWEYDISKGKVWGSEEAFDIYGIERTSPQLPLDRVEACIPDAQRVNKALIDLIQEKKKYDIEFEVRKEINGETILIHSIAELVLENDIPIKVLGVIQDITVQKQAERERESLKSQLQQAQKMESIGTLAGGIAHDFNNILFPIVGNTEMLLEDIPENSPLRDNLNAVFDGAMRAKDLVKQILTFSRQDSFEIKLMKMQPVIKEALKLIRSTIPTTIEIKQYISSECGAIKADPTQIHQVVMNLATNAYHAMEDTGGELKVNLKEIVLGEQDLLNPNMEPGTYASLTVADTGVGMDKDVRENIFDPYFTTKEIGKGTGMGLSVVHGIVHNAGGSIQVNSIPGQGTEFHIYLPVVKSFFEQQETQIKEPIQRGTEQILLVDDEEAIAFMEKQMLERLGYSVVSRTSSVEALEAFRANPDKFDLVITDMAMPNMSGDKLASELVTIRSDIPILLCTGFSERMPEERAKTLGIKGFLMKPIVLKDLSNKIREVLDNKESSGQE